MHNNKETNDNVSKVVADFFKSRPLAKQNGGHKRRTFNNRNNHLKKQASENDTASGTSEVSAEAASGDSNVDNNNAQRNDRFNNRRRGRNNYNNRDRKSDFKETIKDSEVTDNEAAVEEETATIKNTDVKAEQDFFNKSNVHTSTEFDKSSSDSENEWYDPNVPVEIIGVRFKAGGKIYYFAPMGIKASKGDNVIVETARGLEFGTVHIPNSTVKIKEVVMPLKNVVRIATPDDEKHHEENNQKVVEAMRVCNERIAVHNLEMKLVDVEYTFDNSKLLFYFTSEGRVDFRELVKDLAGIFKTRIELRQIGIREETKLLGGIGICGLPFCCKTFLNDFVQVSIKMAKEQGLSLNSAKISGACGRLMCCLRYEYDTYDEEIRKTPKVDTPVITPDGQGVICETQPLAGLCKVKLTSDDETVIKVYHRDDLKPLAQADKKHGNKNEPKQDLSESK